VVVLAGDLICLADAAEQEKDRLEHMKGMFCAMCKAQLTHMNFYHSTPAGSTYA
jgi:hypothetical protein